MSHTSPAPATTSAHKQKFTFGLQLLLQVEIVFGYKTESVPSCGPDNVQTTIPAEVIIVMRQLIRATFLCRQREEEDSCRTVSRSAVRAMNEVLSPFKPAVTLETQRWCLLLGRIRLHVREEKGGFQAQTTGGVLCLTIVWS